MAGDKSKYYYLTAAPVCALNAANAPAQDLLNKITFDMVFVQFYNSDDCGIQTDKYDFKKWSTWAQTSANPQVRIFMGIPGDHKVTETPGNGYLAPDQLKGKIASSKSDSGFAGALIWDASQAFNNTDVGNYAQAVKGLLG